MKTATCRAKLPPPSFYNQTNKGFTLIELLVVVLIIGILAAVALPQYTKTVEKSRAAEAVLINKALADAERRYFLENGKYTADLSELDVDLKDSKNYTFYFTVAASAEYSVAKRVRPTGQEGYAILTFLKSPDYPEGTTLCLEHLSANEWGRSMCRTIGSGEHSYKSDTARKASYMQ